jgi:hypothetical protein
MTVDRTQPGYKYLLLTKQYVVMARQARAIGRLYPSRRGTSYEVARTYMRLARSAYNTFLITAIYSDIQEGK